MKSSHWTAFLLNAKEVAQISNDKHYYIVLNQY